MNIVFVILNYNIYKETINCVESITANLDTDSFHIIIVDNASKTEAGKILADFFQNNKNVSVIINKENVGFARGNNIGINEAKTRFSPKFIVCINNDILFVQKDFYKQLEQEYNNTNAAVIGPQIILKDGRIQHVNKKLSCIAVYKDRVSNLIQNKNDNSYLKEKLLQNRLLYELNFLRKKYRNERNSSFQDVILHGCCLIFTPIFFEKLEGFDKRTFLYAEEQLLYIALRKNNLHNLYTPKLRIKHLEDLSTKSITKSNKEKNEFIRKHSIDSLKILVDELEANKTIIYGI